MKFQRSREWRKCTGQQRVESPRCTNWIKPGEQYGRETTNGARWAFCLPCVAAFTADPVPAEED